MKKFLNITSNPNETLQDVRIQLLHWIIIVINILGIPVVTIGFIEALSLNHFIAAYLYLICYSPILLVTIFRKKISFNLSAGMILLSVYIIGVFNLIIYGFSGASTPIFFTLLVLTTVFFDIKAGFRAVILCLLPMIIIGFLYIQNKLSLDITLQEINTFPISWLTASAVFVLLGILIITSFGLIQKKMLHSLKFSKQKAEELKKLNLQLNEDILEKKKIEIKLRNFQEHLEELVNERTKELNLANKELEERNIKLEEFNELFVDREFRIKELKDKVKELENK